MPEEKNVKEEKKEPKKTSNISLKLRKNPWMIATIVLAIACLVFIIFLFKGSGIGANAAGQKLVDFAKVQGVAAEIVKINDAGNMYAISFTVDGQAGTAFVTKDGKYFISSQGVVALDEVESNSNTPTNTPENIPKTDKPKVELFVMSYCPFGTQAEKGLIPAIQALGSKIDAKIRFVYYTMHGAKEDEENARQICLREQQADKFLPYLSCFLEDANYSRCISKVGVNSALLSSCIATNQSGLYLAADKELNTLYEVQGSPTLVINGVETSNFGKDRSAANALSLICNAFNTAPSECSQTLSATNPSAGFGYEAGTANTGSATCG